MDVKLEIQYYWCVNCGNYGKFPYKRLIKHNCEKCDYDTITGFELEEIMENEHNKRHFGFGEPYPK